MPDRVLAATPYLRFIDRDGWAFVERVNAVGVVTIVAVTRDDKLLLVDQVRKPFQRNVIELPAGLVGDDPADRGEDLAVAAERELREETGYAAGRMRPLATCASSPGISNETVSFFLATELTRVAPGGGVDDENIVTHEIPLAEVRAWLRAHRDAGGLVAAKVYAGLALLEEATP